MSIASKEDERFCPSSYFGPTILRKFRISKIKNAVVRSNLEELVLAGRLDEVDDLIADDGFSPEVLKTLEAYHPMFMGGNYLPDLEEGEVEIARIELDSVTADVTALYAKREGAEIRLRVVDEYEGEMTEGNTSLIVSSPLSLGEMTDFFLNAYPLGDILQMNDFEDRDQALGFFQAKSKFYPGFHEACVRRVQHVLPTQDSSEEDVDDQD